MILRSMGNLDDAIKYGEEALQMRLDIHPIDAFGSANSKLTRLNRLAVCASYNNLAIFYKQKGLFAEAIQYYQQAEATLLVNVHRQRLTNDLLEMSWIQD